MKLYRIVFFVSNICIPIALLLFQYFKKMTKKQEQEQQMSVDPTKLHLGNIFLMLILMLVFNVLNYFFIKDYTIMAVGLILKIIVLYLPQKLNSIIQDLIQKIHLQKTVQKLKILFIEFYLRVNWNINSVLLSYLSKNKRTIILNQQKQIIEELQKDESSNIAVSHKTITQNLIKNVKCFQNTGVNCNIISTPQAQINKQILSYLKEKLPEKHHNKRSFDQKIQPTKQISISLNEKNKTQQLIMTQRPTKNQILSQSLLTERVSQTHNNKSINIQARQQLNNMKKEEVSKGNTRRYLQDQVFKNSLKNSQKSGQIQDHQKQSQHKMNYLTQFQGSKSFRSQQELQKTQNPNNVGIIDINMSQSSRILKNSLSVSNCLQQQFVKSELVEPQQNNTQDIKLSKIRSSFLPSGINISSIQIKKSHPFQINLSSLTNPLRISKNELLTPSLINIRNSQNLPQTNLENVNKQILVQSFSQSSIPNKLQNSVSESEYSDMFDSEQENQNKVQCKVQAVVQKEKKENEPKARLQIYMIELYNNSDLKFYSLYDKIVFQGRLLRMIKKPDNYYDLIVQEYKINEQDSKNESKSQKREVQQSQKQGVQITKRVKFRGQAKLFMKYLVK